MLFFQTCHPYWRCLGSSAQLSSLWQHVTSKGASTNCHPPMCNLHLRDYLLWFLWKPMRRLWPYSWCMGMRTKGFCDTVSNASRLWECVDWRAGDIDGNSWCEQSGIVFSVQARLRAWLGLALHATRAPIQLGRKMELWLLDSKNRKRWLYSVLICNAGCCSSVRAQCNFT